ncbi:MAG: glycosyltransferase [Isosphaeraceae bacterium]
MGQAKVVLAPYGQLDCTLCFRTGVEGAALAGRQSLIGWLLGAGLRAPEGSPPCRRPQVSPFFTPDFLWVDDFAVARNSALARATGDYAVWLDADDVIDPPERAKLEAILEGLPPPARFWEGEPPRQPGLNPARAEPRTPGPTRFCAGEPPGELGPNPARAEPRTPGSSGRCSEPAAYVVKCACDPGQDGSGGDTVVDHIRLFPLRQYVRWTCRVHEQILPAQRRANVPVRWTDVTVRHTGYTELRKRELLSVA